MSKPRAIPEETVRELREWRAKPRGQRGISLAKLAARKGVSPYAAQHAAYGMRAYREEQ